MKDEQKGIGKPFQKLIAHYRGMNVAVRASLWFTITSIVQKGISFITMPVFTRLMNMEQYGQYNVYLTWYNILNLLVTLNVHSEIFNKGLIEHRDEKDDYTSSQAGLLIALAGLWISFYLLFRGFFNQLLGLSTVLVLFMIFEILGTALVGLWSARRRFEFDYPKIVRLTLAMSVMNPIVGIAAVLMSDQKAEAKSIANAVVPLAVSVVLLFIFSRKGRIFGNFQWWRPVVTACLPLIPHYLSLVLLNQSDKLMIKHFCGSSEAAIYSLAHTAGLLMIIVNNSINGSFVPWAYDKLQKENGRGIKKLTNSLLGIVALVNIILIWLAPEAVKILAAPEYGEAIWCLVPISVSVYFCFAYTLFVDVEVYFGANRYIAVASVCAAVLNIILNYLFVPKYGYIAAGYTTLFSYFATMVLHLLFMYHIQKIKHMKLDLFDLRIMTLFAAVLIAFSALAMLLYRRPIIRLSIVAAVLCIIAINRKRVFHVLKKMHERQGGE